MHRNVCWILLMLVWLGALARPTALTAPVGDVFNSNSPRYGGGNTTGRTGKQATQDDSVYCQQTPDGRVVPQPYGGTRRNITCGAMLANFGWRR